MERPPIQQRNSFKRTVPVTNGTEDSLIAEQLFNLRSHALIPPGKCIYIQSGDPSDFDGYLIAVAGTELEVQTRDMQFVMVIPERRACGDRTEADVNKHDDKFSQKVLTVSGKLFRTLCPKAYIVRGPLNQRNVIPLKFIFSEPEKYGPLLEGRAVETIYWRTVHDLANLIKSEEVVSVVLDMNGSMGYLAKLLEFYPGLGAKVKASQVPITIMAGIDAEKETTTLRVPGRDPRATMNAIYHAEATGLLLQMAQQHHIPLLIVTNNTCNQLLKFEDAEDVINNMQLQGLLEQLATTWYGPHLKGKCVPFDWVSFVSMLAHGRFPHLVKTKPLQLYVGETDPSVLVLRDPSLPETDTVRNNLEGTVLWGEVESVVDVDRQAMLALAHYLSHKHILV